MPVSEFACVFARLAKDRLAAAERFVRAIPAYVGAEGEIDFHHCEANGRFAAVVRAAPEALSPGALARLGFWSARAGATGFLVDDLSSADRARFRAEVDRCDRAVTGTPFAGLEDAAIRFFGALGAPAAEPPGARPVLEVDLDGPGVDGIAYRPEARALFVAGVLAPPVGDRLALCVRDARRPAPIEGLATVIDVRGREDAAPGSPAGFTLRVDGPPALHELLATRGLGRTGPEARSAPRFSVVGRVKVVPAAAALAALPAGAAAGPAPTPRPRARIEYATEQELAADWIENLSHGGAFVRTAEPQPEGAELTLELALPDGVRLAAKAVVAFVNASGMGVRFVLSPEEDGVLAAAMARISARPSRVLVVDDDALSRRMLSDAFAARGFEVLTAEDVESGLRTLIDELLTLDLFVTDVVLPGGGGEALIRVIREAGGEADLAVVAVSAGLAPATERTLESAGADAVLDKSLGPELIAQAADAALERKRLLRQADAA